MADDAGALLVRAGLISAEALATARALREQEGGTIGEHLVSAGLVSDDTLTEFYRTRLLVPQVHPNTLAKLSPKVLALLPADLAAELRAVPVALDRDDSLTVAMSDPSDRHAVDEIGFFTGKYVVRAVATQMQISWCLAQYYDCLTELGERLLQPVGPSAAAAPAAPAAPAAVPDTVKPRLAQRGDTGRVEAARHKVLAPVTTPPPAAAARPTAATLDRAAPAPLPAPAPVAAAQPAPLPRGAFGGDTPDTPLAWRAPAAASPPAGSLTAVQPGSAGAEAAAVPSPADQTFDDTPSIIISYEASQPVRTRPARPDPPELHARAGELEIIELANRIFEAPTATIEINFGDDVPASETPTIVPPAAAITAPIAAPLGEPPPLPATAATSATSDTPGATIADHDGRDRPLTAPVIEVIADEPSAPVAAPAEATPIPIAAAPEAETHRVSGPVLATIAQAGPPDLPARVASPRAATIRDTGELTPGTDAVADDEPRREPRDTEVGAPAGHGRPPAAVVEDEVVDEDPAEPILLLTARRSGAHATVEPAAAARPPAVVVESADEPSAPVLLTDRMRRRETRRRDKLTMVGLGFLGPIPHSVEPAAAPYAAPTHAPPTQPAQRATTVPEALDDTVTTRSRIRFEEHDPLDDGWGPPGSTIPPDFLGAVPSEIDDTLSEPLPAAPPTEPTAVPVAQPEPSATVAHAAPPAPARPGSTTARSPLPAIPPPRATSPSGRATTLTPLNRNRAVAGVPDADHLAELLEQASQRLVELLHALDGATRRDDVIGLIVDFVAEAHHRVAFLALKADELTPFMQVPPPSGPPARLDLRHAATFQDVIGTRLPYRGPIADAASRELVRALYGSATDEMLLVPVAVRDRVVGVLYADGRHRHSFDEHVTVAGRAAGLALERILKDRKQ